MRIEHLGAIEGQLTYAANQQDAISFGSPRIASIFSEALSAISKVVAIAETFK